MVISMGGAGRPPHGRAVGVGVDTWRARGWVEVEEEAFP